MVVRNLKCPQCGSIKMNELTTGYIYCDFCSALMGFDLKNMTDESKDVFSYFNMSKPKQKQYISLVQQMGTAYNNEDTESYVDIQVSIKELEFELFPKRFSPKAKQAAYRKNQLDFTRAYWKEMIENNYFIKSKAFRDKITPLIQNLTSHAEKGKTVYEFNDAFKEYLKETDEFTKTSVKESLQMKCMEIYPEMQSPAFDILYKQSIDAALQMFDTDTVSEAIRYLNLESEYITIDDIESDNIECLVCGSFLKVPVGSKAMVCETCGNVNDFGEKKIKCISCGAPVDFKVSNTCEYCGAVHLAMQKEDNQNVKTQSKKKGGGFFSKLFGN